MIQFKSFQHEDYARMATLPVPAGFDATREIRCVFSPTLADLSCREFDVVAIDEGVKMKGADSLIGQGIRRMVPPHRLVLTATPIKNRLADIFFLLAWGSQGAGGVLGHDTGLGKTISAFTLPLLWLAWAEPVKQGRSTIVPNGRVLLVIPGGLHRRVIREGRRKFGIELTPLPDQQTYLRLCAENGGRLPHGFYLTSYTQLCRNGVEKAAIPDDCVPTLRRAHCEQEVDYFKGIGEARFYDGRTVSQRPCGANSRFPFEIDSKEQARFAAMFQVSERNLSKERQAKAEGRAKPPRKLTPEVCNVHGLWKLIGPNVLRRRKEDTGEPIVKKLRHVVRVPLGREQAEIYRYHLEANYFDDNGQVTLLPKLQALRMAAANPASARLQMADLQYKSNQRLAGRPFRSRHTFTPKVNAALRLAAQRLALGEQVLYFSPFQSGLDALAEYFRQTALRFEVADGRMTEHQRGLVAERFEEQEFPVLLVSNCMAEGNNFYRCRNVVLTAFDWAWDAYEQIINRVHRMTSPEDVNVWSILCDGTIDARLDELRIEKGDSQELVLDGKLITEPAAELNLADLYDNAVAEFARAETIDESALFGEWLELKQRLNLAGGRWIPRQPGTVVEEPAEETVRPDNIIPFPGPTAVTPALNAWHRRFLQSQA